MRRPKSVTKQGERWGTPKQYQRKYQKVAHVGGRRDYPCKRLKGEHDFKVVEVSKVVWFDPNKYWTTERCTACGKKRITFK